MAPGARARTARTPYSPLADPSAWFVGACALAPPALAALADAEAKGMLPDAEALAAAYTAYATHPLVAGAAAVTAVAAYAMRAAGRGLPPLPASDARAASWYLLNATVVKSLMDGLHDGVPALRAAYARADARFATGCGSEGAPELDGGAAAACVVTTCELVVMAPLCALLAYAYAARWRCRDALELVVCTLQAFGTVAFAGPQLLLKFRDVWRGWELSVSSVAYFWFAFAACMPVWLVVPALLGARAWRRLDAALARAAVYREVVRASPDFATYKTR